MTEPKKAMTFEEWYKPEWDNSLEDCWNSARIGMIPAENAVVVPEVREWPEEAKGVLIGFDANGDSTLRTVFKVVAYIPRPTPAWTPKIGEAVFAWNGSIWVAKVLPFPDGPQISDFYIQCSDGQRTWWGLKDLKPFSESAIGKPWSEI